MPDGVYALGRQTVRKCDNGVRLADGTLAGSCLTMIEAFRNLVAIGLSIEEASRRTSALAADYLGLEDRGRIVPDAVADFVILDERLACVAVVARGREIDLRHGARACRQA
jgi:N-acetylglucosamine-6-phosphate deacetylase